MRGRRIERGMVSFVEQQGMVCSVAVNWTSSMTQYKRMSSDDVKVRSGGFQI